MAFDKIWIKEGLSQSTVNAIVQDERGFMWFGTQDGLNRYDGYSITVFKPDPNDSNSISDIMIRSLLSDSRGDLWIGTERGGIDRYVFSEDTFYNYRYSEDDTTTVSDNFVTALYEDDNDNIWIGTLNGELNLFKRSQGTFQRFQLEESQTARTNRRIIWDIIQDSSGDLLIATNNGLFKLQTDVQSYLSDMPPFKQYEIIALDTVNSRLSNTHIRSIHIDSKGILWIGTAHGLNRFNKENNTIRHYIYDRNDIQSLPSNNVNAIYEDSRGELWIGTHDAGLVAYDRRNDNFIRYSGGEYRALYECRSGILWIGTFSEGVKIYDRRRRQFKHYDYSQDGKHTPGGSNVFAIYEDGEGELWVGTFGNGLDRLNKRRDSVKNYMFDENDHHSIGSNKILALAESSDGSIWVGTVGGGLNKFNKKTGKFIRYTYNQGGRNGIRHDQISELYYDYRSGLLWIGYLAGGISSFDFMTNKFTHYLMQSGNQCKLSGHTVMAIRKGKENGYWVGTFGGGAYRFFPESDTIEKMSPWEMNSNEIMSIFEEENGIVWFGTYGGGLNRYDPVYDTITFYTSADGLPSNVVYGILPDGEGNFWLSTNRGISRFNLDSGTFRNYNVAHGLQANEFNQGAYFANRSGEFFFGGVGGFNVFRPQDIQDNEYIPPVYITSFKVFDKVLPLSNPIPQGTHIELSYSENFFSFDFVALNYTSPENNQYAYTLDGFDKTWHNVDAQQRFASYTNLDPGKYTLRVKGSNNDGVWNETEAFIAITVTPPYWMTWWFRSLGIIFLVSLVFFVYHRRVSTLKREKELQQDISNRLISKQEEERKRIALEIHDSLGPHIIFIKNRSHSSMNKSFDAQAAHESFNQISSAASGVLNTVREISHNLRPPELDQIGLTETLRSILMTARESTTIEINGEVENIDGLIAHDLEINLVRILQEALRNIIEHSEATECEIIIKNTGDRILLSIRDNGKGFNNTHDERPSAHGNFRNDSEERKSGLGLTGMKQRVGILGGVCTIRSAIGRGTRIEIQIPVNR